MPTCLLVRHGRTAANASGTLAGWTPGVDLDDTGRSQAAALAARVRGLPVRTIVASPLTRCLQTADVLRHDAWPDAQVTEDDRLGECHYGSWTGRPLAELAEEPLWRVVQDHPSGAVFPDGDDHRGESLAGMAARSVAAVRDADARVAAEHGEDAVWAAVTHGDVIKAIVADAVGAHLDHFQRIVVPPASLTVVRYTRRRPFLLRLGDTGDDLAALGPAAPGTGRAGAAAPAGSDGAVGGGA